MPAVLFHWLYYSFFFCNINVRGVLAEMNHSCRRGWLCSFFLWLLLPKARKGEVGDLGIAAHSYSCFPAPVQHLVNVTSDDWGFQMCLAEAPRRGLWLEDGRLSRSRAQHSGRLAMSAEAVDREEVSCLSCPCPFSDVGFSNERPFAIVKRGRLYVSIKTFFSHYFISVYRAG